jgi:hypothetical protein
MAVDFDTYYKKNRCIYAKRLLPLFNTFQGRCPRMKPRDPIEEKLLIESCIKRWNRMLASGEIEEIAPRVFRWHI